MKNLALIALFVGMASVANAQSIKLDVTMDEVNLISDGLQTQAFGKVFPLMQKLRQQVMDQQPKPAEEKKPEDKSSVNNGNTEGK